MTSTKGTERASVSPSPVRAASDTAPTVPGKTIAKLRVQVLGASNLVSKDRNGKSDPFIVLNLPGAPPPPPSQQSQSHTATSASSAAASASSSSSATASASNRRDRDYYRRVTPVHPKTLNPEWQENAIFEWDITSDWLGVHGTTESHDDGLAGTAATTRGDVVAPTAVTSSSLKPVRPSNVRKLSAATGKILTAPVRMTTKGAKATTRVLKKGGNSVRSRPRPMRRRRGQESLSGYTPVGSAALGSDGLHNHAGAIGAIEFVIWDKDRWSGNDYMGECSLQVDEWVLPGESADWTTSKAQSLPIRTTRRNAKVSGEVHVRIGIVPTTNGMTADEVYARLMEGSSNDEHAGVRSVPADLSVGTSGPAEAFLDDGFSSDSGSEAREELLSDDDSSDDGDRDDVDTDGFLSVTDAEDLSDSDVARQMSYDTVASLSLDEAHDSQGIGSTEHEGAASATEPVTANQVPRRTLVGRLRKTGSYIVSAGRSGSASSSHPASGAVSDAAEEDATSANVTDESSQRRRRIRMRPPVPRRRRRQRETDSSLDPAASKERKNRRQRRLEARQRQQDYSLKASMGMDIMGIVQMEIEGANDLPRWRNSLGTSFDMDAFAVISFGQRIFRTRVARHSLNPVWEEKLLFHVRRHEANFLVKLAVYDWDKLSANDFVADTTLAVADLIDAAPKADPITGLYEEQPEGTQDEMRSITLSLSRTERAGEGKHVMGKHEPKLLIKARYTPYSALRQRFWRQLLRQYDTNDSGTLSTLEFTAMLDSLGSTLSAKTINDLFEHYGKKSTDIDAEGEDLELTVDQAIIALEAELMKPHSQKRIVRAAAVGAGSFDEATVSGLQTPADEIPTFTQGEGIDYVGPQAPILNNENELAQKDALVPPAVIDGPPATGRFARPLQHDSSSPSLITSTSARSASSASMSSVAPTNMHLRTSPSPVNRVLAQDQSAQEKEVSKDAEADDDPDQVERIIVLRSCPLCRMPRLNKRAENDVITHLAVCASQDWRRVDSMVVGNYVTAMQAHRKFVTRMFAKISQGSYSLGANSANIIVQDRRTGELLEEKMQAYVRLGIRLLYKGARSRMEGARIKRMLKNMSIKQGVKYDSPHSAREIPHFIAFHSLNVEEIREPIESFKTFNEFFYRKLKEGARPVDDAGDATTLVSGADCRLMVFPSVTEATRVWIKGRSFSIERLLGDGFLPRKHKKSTWATELDTYRGGGAFVIHRLAPQDYHRFHCPADCRVGEITTIQGEYFTVNPMAIRSLIDVYCENVRVIVPLISKEFGTFYYVCIGAMMVGSTCLTIKEGDELKRGDEVGFFKFGGSTICMSFPENVVEFDDDLVTNSSKAIETLVRVGMRIGKSTRQANGAELAEK